MTFVLDASVAIAWVLHDEEGYRPLELIENLRTTAAIVPVHWHFEVTNALLMAERRGRISMADTTQFLGFLDGLPIETAIGAGSTISAAPLALAREQGLTVYDAIYLDLAMRTGRALATLDQASRRAAAQTGVKTIP